jgi:cytochrome c oxidase subunit 2
VTGSIFAVAILGLLVWFSYHMYQVRSAARPSSDTAAAADERRAAVEAGKQLFIERGCQLCHSLDGSAGIGPTALHPPGTKRPLAGGGVAELDDAYLRESILEPRAKMVQGFDPVMPSYEGLLTEPELAAIVEYLKSMAQ